jgi:hypothetical protein
VRPVRVRGETAVHPEAWAELLTRQISLRLRERAHAWELHDVTAPPIGEMLDRVLALLPSAAPNTLDAEIGPFYDTAGVEALLGGVSKQAVEARRRARTILALKTTDGRWAYPTFQFTGGDVDPALVPAIQAFRDAPPWSAALWFVTANPDLDGATPLDWVRNERPSDVLLSSAQRTAREWL